MFTELWGTNDPIEIWEWGKADDNDDCIKKEFEGNKHFLQNLQKLDISECSLIEPSGIFMMTEACGQSLKELQASNC